MADPGTTGIDTPEAGGLNLWVARGAGYRAEASRFEKHDPGGKARSGSAAGRGFSHRHKPPATSSELYRGSRTCRFTLQGPLLRWPSCLGFHSRERSDTSLLVAGGGEDTISTNLVEMFAPFANILMGHRLEAVAHK